MKEFAYWGNWAATIAANGFSPVPVLPRSKRPRFSRWINACYAAPDPAFIDRHSSLHGSDSIGLACGKLREGDDDVGFMLAVDCDADDPDCSAEFLRLTEEHLGWTPLIRFGRPSRWVRLFRFAQPVQSYRLSSLEILGAGRQVLASVDTRTHVRGTPGRSKVPSQRERWICPWFDQQSCNLCWSR